MKHSKIALSIIILLVLNGCAKLQPNPENQANPANSGQAESGQPSGGTAVPGTAAFTFSHNSGTYGPTLSVSFTPIPADATICYTLGTTPPACNANKTSCFIGALYTTPVSISGAARTLMAIGCKTGYNDSAVENRLYTVDNFAPTDPTGFTATPVSSSQINLSWGSSMDGSAVVYEICWATSTNCNPSLGSSTSNTTFSATGLSPNTLYFFSIRARDAYGNLSSSNGQNGTTLP